MAIQNDNTLVTKGDLKDLYSNKIAPYLGANLQMKTNVSDYYSTDDKIVGVWLDGRPIHQKTYRGVWGTITDGTVSTITVAELPSDLGGIHTYRGQTQGRPLGSSWGANNQYFFNASIQTGSQGQYLLTVECNRGVMSNKNYFVTIQYTKATDAASSATTTPGAYDINFPNTWPENTEIYFGNGLYGYRATGSMNMTKQAHNNVDCGVTAATFINQGGHWKANANYDYPFGCNWSGNGSSSIAWIDHNSSNQLKLAFWPEANITNSAYDVWVTYTK